MLISGFARAGSLLDDDEMLDDAVATADFVLEKLIDDDGRLLRTYDFGRARVPAFLDDLAGMLEACLDLQRAGAGERFFAAALRFADDIATRFFDEEASDLFLTPSDGEPLVVRPRSDHDGATPHSAGLATMGLLRAASIAGRSDLRSLADRVLQTHASRLEHSPEALPTLARAALAAERGLSLALIVGNPEDAATRALAARARTALRPEDAVLVVQPEISGKSQRTQRQTQRIQPRTRFIAHRCRPQLDQRSGAGGWSAGRLRLSRCRVLVARTFARRVDDTLLNLHAPVC